MSLRDTQTRTESARRTAETDDCPECDGRLEPDPQRGETACAECGLVVADDEIDGGPEWRDYDDSDGTERSRVGPPLTKTRHDDGLSTTIGWRDADANGNALGPRQRERMRRLRTWNTRFQTRDPKERSLKQALGEIDRMASALGLPEHVRETASVIYRRAVEEDLLPGRSIEAVASAALYAAARQSDVPRNLKETARVSRIDRREIVRAYRYVTRELGLGVEPADPGDYLTRFVSDLGLDGGVEVRARRLLEEARDENVDVGKSPVSLAAAAVYAATLLVHGADRLTQVEVSEVTDVSEVTIRTRYRDLLRADDDCLL
ncbi:MULTISPECIES: transcription initiation factor IIB [Halorussus]|uniref:transcription initiation factor IIB n=1 Tax=Halorussus TaxID=1070314 RepID=UPI0020A20AF6|nr:TFIIB-type zinc ribbon-containing protein [Halorussus vallis]USZ74476.1 transcription initiation factor IIB 2 [Halorussus vallis]